MVATFVLALGMILSQCLEDFHFSLLHTDDLFQVALHVAAANEEDGIIVVLVDVG